MPQYEYKVVPAPAKGTKSKAVKTPAGRFALSVETVLNQMGSDGWEYLRAELLPSEERSGLTGSTTHWRNVLVFRRTVETESSNLLDDLDEMLPEPDLSDAVAMIEPLVAASVIAAPVVTVPVVLAPESVSPAPVIPEPAYVAPVEPAPAPAQPDIDEASEKTVLMPLPNIRPD